jgi:RNA polymerase sigma-70 factor, ECF subfamily
VRIVGGHGRPQRPGAAEAPGTELAALLTEVAKGDLAAFDQVYDRIAAPVFGVARSVLRDASLAEEVSQDVLVEIWRTAARFDPGRGSAMAWVTTIAHRRAVDRVRAEVTAARRLLRAASPVVAYDEVAETVEAELDREQVRRCLGALTDLQRESVTLAYYLGYSYREVATLLGVPAGTVSTRMRDGLIRLRDCMGVGR